MGEGDCNVENSSISLFFGQHKRLFIRQVKEWGEILIGLETKNKYQITDDRGQVVGFCAEQGNGIWAYIKRYFLRNHRSLEVLIFDNSGKTILRIDRPFFWFFSTMFVYGENNEKLGQIEQRFAFFRKKYDLFLNHNNRFATINSSFFKFFTFKICDDSGREIGMISKKWGGFVKEIFTDADKFGVEFSINMEDQKKAVILANAISIDFDFFEDNSNGGGIF